AAHARRQRLGQRRHARDAARGNYAAWCARQLYRPRNQRPVIFNDCRGWRVLSRGLAADSGQDKYSTGVDPLDAAESAAASPPPPSCSTGKSWLHFWPPPVDFCGPQLAIGAALEWATLIGTRCSTDFHLAFFKPRLFLRALRKVALDGGHLWHSSFSGQIHL